MIPPVKSGEIPVNFFWPTRPRPYATPAVRLGRGLHYVSFLPAAAVLYAALDLAHTDQLFGMSSPAPWLGAAIAGAWLLLGRGVRWVLAAE